jgi:hypothetical protein
VVDGGLFFHYQNHPNPPYVLPSYFRATNLPRDIHRLARSLSGLIWGVDRLDFRLQEYSSWMSFEWQCRSRCCLVISVGAVTCGFPQESVLGLVLFISYIKKVSRVVRYCRFHIFVDFQWCIDELNLDLQRWLIGVLDFTLFKATCIAYAGYELEGGWLCHLLCHTLDMRVLCMLMWMLHRIWLLEPVCDPFLLWGGLIMYLTRKQ